MMDFSKKTIAVNLLADGSCAQPLDHFRELIEKRKVQSIKITIDGNQLMSKNASGTLLGNDQKFLTQSQRFRLSKLTPKSNGQCELLYTLAS